jgi:hypothetical protein
MFPDEVVPLLRAPNSLLSLKNPMEFHRCRRRKSSELSRAARMGHFGFGTSIRQNLSRKCTFRLESTTAAPTWN